MKQSAKLVIKTKQKITTKQKFIVIAGTSAIAGLVVALYLFFNFSDVKEAKASQSIQFQAGGFEDGLNNWIISGAGTWEVTSVDGEYRAGRYAAQLTTAGSKEGVLENTNYMVQVPENGTNYITVIVYAKASHCKNMVTVGLISQSGNEVLKGQGIVADSAWTVVQATFPVKNGEKYYPVLYGRRGNEGPMTHITFDDLVIYCSKMPVADFNSPEKPTLFTDAVAISAKRVPLRWNEGKDAGTGLSGSLILRANGISGSIPQIKPQTTYSSGMAFNKDWKIVYSGDAANMFTDIVDSASTYTYLIYHKDMAYNYSAPLQLIARAENKNRPFVDLKGDTLTLASNTNVNVSQVADGKLTKTGLTGIDDNASSEKKNIIKAWYNQLDNKIYTRLNNMEGKTLTATLISISGQTAGRQIIPAHTGETRINFDMTGLSNGIYTIILEGGEKTRALKVVKN